MSIAARTADGVCGGVGVGAAGALGLPEQAAPMSVARRAAATRRDAPRTMRAPPDKACRTGRIEGRILLPYESVEVRSIIDTRESRSAPIVAPARKGEVAPAATRSLGTAIAGGLRSRSPSSCLVDAPVVQP